MYTAVVSYLKFEVLKVQIREY